MQTKYSLYVNNYFDSKQEDHMSNLTIFDPFREMTSLRSMLDQAFDNMLIRRSEFATEWLAMDMYQTDDDIIIKAVLPGIKAEDLSISITNDVLNIQGETKEEKATEKTQYHIRERKMGSFSRSIQLPARIIADKAEAKFEDGILTLTLPKAEETKPKTISVKVK
jgi:HSP20 family protein